MLINTYSLLISGCASFDVLLSFASKTEPETLLREILIEVQYLLIKQNEYINSLKLTMND